MKQSARSRQSNLLSLLILTGTIALVFVFLLILVSPVRAASSEPYRYGTCLPEAAAAAVDGMNRDFSDMGRWRIDKSYSEYDRITTGVTEDHMKHRSYYYVAEKTEMITWANTQLSVSVTVSHIEGRCNILKVDARRYKK